MGICATTEEDTQLHESDDALSNDAPSSASAAAFGSSKPKAAMDSVKTGHCKSCVTEPTSPSVERLSELDKEREQIDDQLKAVLHDVAGTGSISRSPSSPSPEMPAAEPSSPPAATEAQVPVFSPLTAAKIEVKAAEQYMNSIEKSPARFGYQVACFETVTHQLICVFRLRTPRARNICQSWRRLSHLCWTADKT